MNLVLLVCLAASPETCREERLLVSYDLADVRSCMMGSVPVIAEWAESHPEWQVSRWKCGLAPTPASRETTTNVKDIPLSDAS